MLAFMPVVVHFELPSALDNIQAFHNSLNALLPASIRVHQVAAATRSFHARYSAVGKTYRYYIQNSPILDPFLRHFYFHEPLKLDTEAIECAAALLTGTHDFAAYANTSPMKSRNSIRTILRFDLVREDEFRFYLEVEGTGFLYRQVRAMVGILLQIGRGVLPPSAAKRLLETCSREQVALAGPAAGPGALFLMSVNYPSHALVSPLGAPSSSQGNYKSPRSRYLRSAMENTVPTGG